MHSELSNKENLQRQVQLTEERYRSLFDQATEGIVIAGLEDMRILELNPAAMRLLGIQSCGAEERPFSEFCLVNPEARDYFKETQLPYLTKPVKLAELEEMIIKVLETNAMMAR